MRAVAATLAGVVLLPVLVIAGGIGALEGEGSSAGTLEMPQRAEIPAHYLSLYTEAAPRFSIRWELLAAVGKVECDHGRGLDCMFPNYVGAAGPMQFMPGTWARWAAASGSPEPSVYDPRDAVFAAAAKLSADGLAIDPWRALYSYNHSDAYVATVLSWALAYGWEPPDAGLLARAVLSHPHLDLRPAAGGDVAGGRVDERVLAVLLVAATRHHLSAVGPFVTGHAFYVRGTTRPSNHAFGRAVDLPVVDGTGVSAANRAARALLELLLSLPETLRPTEIGVPWASYARVPGVFSDDDHERHLHVGYRAG